MKNKYVLIPLILGLCFTNSFAQTPTTGKNAVMEKTPREAMTTLWGTTHTTVQTAIQYFDGLGRPIQTVIYKGSPEATKDILSSITQYDALARAYKSILPTPSDGATGAYKSSAQSLATSFYDNDANPFAETIFEPSPLNRPKQQFGTGQAWRAGAGHSVGMEYLTAGLEILHVEIRASGTIEKVGTYASNSLFCNRTLSERGFKTNEYKDRLGRMVAKSQELTEGNLAITLYVYDDLNRLRIVIPPEAYQALSTLPSFTESSPVFLEGMFSYGYDSRGRLAEKHIPGAGMVRYVYDKNDRVVLENDDREASIALPDKNYYKFTKYDALNRPILSGLIFNIGQTPRASLQTDFDNFNGQTYETISASGILGYTNVSFPSSYTPDESTIRTLTYYDDYAWLTDTAIYNFKSVNAFHAQASAKGMVTGKLIRNVKTNTWQKMVMYYDYQGRVIQEFHFTNRNNLLRKDYQYRFNGELLKGRVEKKNGSTLLSTKIMSYEYDHQGRKIKFKYSLNGNERTIATYAYDAIGRMTKKSYSPSTAMGSSQTGNWTNSTTWQGGSIPTISDQVTINLGHTVTIPASTTVSAGTLFDKGTLQNFGTLNLGTLNPSTDARTLQTLNYNYHIRGGLKGINLDANNNLTDNLFSYKLAYEDDGTYYDGNIRNQYWKSTMDGKQRAYQYIYDGASRLISASYGSTQAGENYTLDSINYDANGNLKKLSRSGATNTNYTSFGNVDNLTYTYQINSNKLLKVQDATTGNADVGDFRDGINPDDDYEYWQDGSLKKDKNKKIASIIYNYLKLPEVITFDDTKTITTEYDAEGTKLKKIVSGGETTDYEEDDIYVNGVLYQTSHDEGRIVNGVYEYNITDHNNDLRVAFRDSLGLAVPTQSVFYDPFGQELRGLSFESNPATKNNFKFLGRESLPEIGLVDLQKRWYDPVIGRFISVDPSPDVEGQESLSPYQYSWNNPVLRSDPNGDCPNCVTAGIGAGIGAILGGGIEAATQLYQHGAVNDWKAVGGAALQGGITGGAAGLTGGASLFVTAGVSAGANVVGGAINNSIQGKANTVQSAAVDAAIGATAGVGGKLIGQAVEKAQVTRTLTNLAGEAQANVTAATGKVAGQRGFGTAAHTEFKSLVDAKQLKNVATEASYINGRPVPYGTAGSSRADAVLFNSNGSVRQVFDLKTGRAVLSNTQFNNYIQNVPGVTNANQITVLK